MREWGRWIKEQQSNKPFRRGRETDDIQTPDVLIAKPTSASGIPARVGDTPGSDTVDIYRIGSDGDLETRGDTKLAYNLSIADIPQDFIVIRRNKQGLWMAEVDDTEILLGKTDEEIAARSTTTTGVGTVSVFKIAGTTLTDTTVNVEAHNMAGSAVATDTYVQMNKDPFSGLWVINFEDCG